MATTTTTTTPPPPPPPQDLLHLLLLPPHKLRHLAQSWLDEDAPSPDPTWPLLGATQRLGHVISKSSGVLAGAPFVDAIFEATGCQVQWQLQDGSWLPPTRTLVAKVQGPGAALLLAERVALNCLSRCSGVATVATMAKKVAQDGGWEGTIAGTRKTTPGFRLAEKYAMMVGGVHPHRYGLGGLLMVKDNQLAVAGESLEKVVGVARRAGGFTHRVAVEVASAQEALEAAGAGADIVLLDNFTPQGALSAAAALKAAHPRVTVEVSGGVTLELLPHFLAPHIDVISMGVLTQSAPGLDFALRVLPGGVGEGREGVGEGREGVGEGEGGEGP